jgi:hypothetical protein
VTSAHKAEVEKKGGETKFKGNPSTIGVVVYNLNSFIYPLNKFKHQLKTVKNKVII